MKSLLLHVRSDRGLESRLQVALDVARAVKGHLSCIHATPMSQYVSMDLAGGTFVLPEVLDAVREDEARDRRAIESRLAREDVPWIWASRDGEAHHVIAAASRLADLIVVSLPPVTAHNPDDPLPLAGALAIESRCPVLAVPMGTKGLDLTGRALVAWDGSLEAGRALRAAMPLLKAGGGEVHVVTVEEPKGDLPALEAAHYCARHGLSAEMHQWPRKGRSVEEALLAARDELEASWIIMGAYGHSRLRELVFGGVTRHLLSETPVPLLLVH